MITIRPSEIRVFLDCERKWAFRREELGGIVDISSTAQLFGTALHKLQENWLLKGEKHPNTPMGNLAKLSVPWLPEPMAVGMKVEERIEIPVNKEWMFVGTPDVRLSVKGRDPSFLFDHKTTSNFKYALSAEALANDTQLILYGSATLIESGASNLVARWLYSLKGEKPDILVREIVVPISQLAPKLETLKTHGERAVDAIRQKKNPLDLAPNFKMCKAYGGCPHRLVCGVPLTEYEKNRMEDKMASDKLKALLDAKKQRALLAETLTVDPEFADLVVDSKDDGPTDEGVALVKAALIPEYAINPPDAATPVEELPPEPAKEKKTRTKKEKPAIETASETTEETLPVDTQTVIQETLERINTYVNEKEHVLTVYADCLPIKGEHSLFHFADFVADAEKAVCESYSVADYRLVDYGKGQGALVIALKASLENLEGTILVDLSSPSQRLCFDAICEKATTVVRGIR